MTREKKLKRAIRARSLKTGESYTAARRHVLATERRQGAGRRPAAAEAAQPEATAPVAETARPAATAAKPVVSDALVLEKTGHRLAHWFEVLDRFGAATKGYTASARHLNREHKVQAWYSQAITLSYQRAHGLRAVNQAFDGGFQVSVSRVVPASVDEIIGALDNKRRRTAWLKSADPELAAALDRAFTGSKPQRVTRKDDLNAMLRFRWGRSRVELYITGKPRGGATVVAWNTKLEGSAEVENRRARWRAALDALKQHLT
jgi:hypothetical protein